MIAHVEAANPMREHRLLLTALFTMTLVVLVYWQSVSRMVEMWSLSTYQHAWLVYPIVLYVLWCKRRALSAVPVRTSWPGVALTGFVVFTWMLSRIAGVQVIEFAAVGFLPFAAFWAVAGTRAIRVAAFPLVLLLAAVPTGEFMVGYLQESTAEIAGALLHVAGVPAFRDGVFLTLPGGSFEVAEVCSGLRYLLAAVLASLAFAYLTYSTMMKRLVFVIVSGVTMVIANGIRAFVVMYVASATDMRVFAGGDHVTFGMVLFAAVFAGLIYIGGRYADRVPATVTPSGGVPVENRSSTIAILAVLLFLAAGPLLQYIQMRQQLPAAGGKELPVLQGCDAPRSWDYDWSPAFENSDYRLRAAYDCGVHAVGVYVAGYLRQQQGSELISSANRVWPHDWRRFVDEAEIAIETGSGSEVLQQVYLRAPGRSVLIWYWYQVGDSASANALGVKVLATLHALGFQPAESSVLVLHVDVPQEMSAEKLRRVLEPKARALLNWYRSGRGPES